MISKVKLPNNQSETWNLPDSAGDVLGDFRTLNILVGPNNSGKSRFLRSMFSRAGMTYCPSGPYVELRKAINEMLLEIERYRSPNGINLSDSFVESLKENHLPELVVYGESIPHGNVNSLLQFIGRLASSHVGPGIVDDQVSEAYLKSIKHEISHIYTNRKKEIDKLINQCKESYDFRWVYIPSMRGVRIPSEDIYSYRKKAFKDYFQGREIRSGLRNSEESTDIQKIEIFTGLEIYNVVRAHLLGDLTQREQIRDFEEYLSHTFFNGSPIALIPRESDSDSELYFKIGKEKEQAIHNLGDGIQHLVINLLPLFIHRDRKLLLFVEEPELYLHPGLQRRLIEAYLEEDGVDNRQVFVATHSNQFLDLTLSTKKMAIFKFLKKVEDTEKPEVLPTFEIRPTSNDDFTILHEIGVYSSSVFLANCTIWVEGITDRMYIRNILRILQKEESAKFEENLHFAFVEYSGNNIAHWSFERCVNNQSEIKTLISATRVCHNIFVIADRDEGKDKHHANMTAILGESYHVLPCREIENLMLPEILLGVVSDFGDEHLIDGKKPKHSEYLCEPLGSFIDDSLLADWRKSKRVRANSTGAYADKSGTIRGDKIAFADKAIARTKDVSDLSEQAIELGKTMLKFIEKHNPQYASFG